MDSITNTLIRYCADTENPEINFELALLYDSIGQTAAAISFYARTADRTDSVDLAYECLIRVSNAFEKQKNRGNTVRGFLKHAISIKPKRPEAYYLLSRHYEWNRLYADSYTTAALALGVCDFDVRPLRTHVGYPGKYGLIFERAVSAWWWGKSAESRKLFRVLAKEYTHILDSTHYNSVRTNLSQLGSGPESQAFVMYDASKYNRLKFKFPGSDVIFQNHSQVYQDMFILSMLNGKREGTYLEIGSADPYHGNNTALLEKSFGWRGVGIEYNAQFIPRYQAERKNRILNKNALDIDYSDLLKEIAVDGVVDYLQLDCEPSDVTYEIMLKIPFDQYKFGVITYEHDDYIDITSSFREKSRKFLQSKGYVLVVNDVSPDGMSNFEDWWVHPDLIDAGILQIMMANDGQTKKVDNYFLNS